MILFLFVFALSALTYGTGMTTDYYLMLFDPVKNAATHGFSPFFLQMPEVKISCLESHIDLQKVGMSDLKYCSKELGTL